MMALRNSAICLVLAAAAVFVGVRLVQVVSFARLVLEDRPGLFWEPWGFTDPTIEAVSACYVAIALGGLLHWRSPWRTVLASATGWLWMVMMYSAFGGEDARLAWTSIILVSVHLGALIFLLVFRVHRLIFGRGTDFLRTL